MALERYSEPRPLSFKNACDTAVLSLPRATGGMLRWTFLRKASCWEAKREKDDKLDKIPNKQTSTVSKPRRCLEALLLALECEAGGW